MNTLLEVHNLTLSMGKKTLCSDLSFHVQPAQTWGILGPNGCGKTTLLHTIAGFHKSKNHIKLFGKPIESFIKRELAKIVGISLQETHDVFPQTVYELCSLGRFPHQDFFSYESTIDHNLVIQALSDMELLGLRDQKIQTLSGGERQRLTLATLLAQAPLLYLLDEPTNHLDIHHQIKILRHFKNLTRTKKTSVIMSLHDINLAAMFCDHILMIFSQGHVIAGPTASILNSTNLSLLYQYPIGKMGEHFIVNPEML